MLPYLHRFQSSDKKLKLCTYVSSVRYAIDIRFIITKDTSLFEFYNIIVKIIIE